MKKSIFLSIMAILSLSMLCSNANAQLASFAPTVSTDTAIVNTATLNFYSPTLTKSCTSATAYVKVTKNSGTVGGTVTLKGTIDGTNYIAVPGATALTLANQATNETVYVLTGCPWRQLKLEATGTGTMNATIKIAKLLIK
jgi:hypothetical protein